MRFKEFLLVENKTITKYLTSIWKYPYKKVIKVFKSGWYQFKDEVKKQDKEDSVVKSINRHLKTRFRSLDDVDRLRIAESTKINEGFGQWWHNITDEAIPSLLFFPMLSVFLELNQFIMGTGGSVKVMVFYAVMYVLLVTGKYEWIEHKNRKEQEEKNPYLELFDNPDGKGVEK